MTIIPLLNVLLLLVTVYAEQYEGEAPPCEDVSVVVDYETPPSEYTMSMTVDDPYGSCGPWDMDDLRKMLLGSGQMWRSTCKKIVPHVLIIEPTVECRGEEWIVQYLTFKLKYVKKVEVYVDDVLVYSEMCGHYFVFKEVLQQPGKTVKIVAYPKWRFSCAVFYDVQVNYCCKPHTTTVTTTTPSTTTIAPTEDCVPVCVPLVTGDLIAPDGAECELLEGSACRWACNGTCFDEEGPLVTELGAFYISKEPIDTDDIAKKCQCCSAASGVWDEFPVTCIFELDIIDERILFVYRIIDCECQPCNGHEPTPTTPEPYIPPYGGKGVPPYGVGPWHPYGWPYPFPYVPGYGHKGYEGGEEGPYEYEEQPPYGPPFPPYPPKPKWY